MSATRIDEVTAADLSRLIGTWADAAGTMPERLAAAITELIDSGVLTDGARLPAQRALAAALSVSRGTVVAAYDALEAGDLVHPRPGSGSRVTSPRSHSAARLGTGRLFSFTADPAARIDLSSGALPGLEIVADAVDAVSPHILRGLLSTDGYFPAGLPSLRAAVADHLTRDGAVTEPGQILITSGAQQAVWIIAQTLCGPSDEVLVEEPSYRGALEAFGTRGARLTGVPLTGDGIDLALLERGLQRRPALLYCQPGIHNPTGRATSAGARRELASVVAAHDVVVVEDASSADLLLGGAGSAGGAAGAAGGLAGLAGLAGLTGDRPARLVSVGTLSKLFWGGIRIGWIRADERMIARLTEAKKAIDLSTSVLDQLVAESLLPGVDAARSERRTALVATLETTTEFISARFPHWSWSRPDGGSGLWVDIGEDAQAFVEDARRRGVKLAAGPAFSAHGGFGTHIRLPLWHRKGALEAAFAEAV